MIKIVFALIAVLAIVSGLVIGTLNAEPVVLDLLWVQLNWPLGLVLVGALTFGVLLGVSATWILQVWPARLALRHREADLKALRPVDDSGD